MYLITFPSSDIPLNDYCQLYPGLYQGISNFTWWGERKIKYYPLLYQKMISFAGIKWKMWQWSWTLEKFHSARLNIERRIES
jgi:hypothetical protein